MNTPSISELESRMRPGAWSEMGFLGCSESLEVVLAQDNQTLKALHISYEQIAEALEKILQSVLVGCQASFDELNRSGYSN